uniref:Uncharacterized protein LOC111119112 n=1 Tax=Crassostrea virginica TaxID=6565 RepID=A0A8B8CG42_CRAVI|nr:uncharacterized protein LOC111119112 [Crassostrea virginica]
MATTIAHRLCRVQSISKFLNATVPVVVPVCYRSKKDRVRNYKDSTKKNVWTPRKKRTIFEEKKQDAEFASRVPDDSVFLMDLFPESEFSIDEAIKLQRDYADPYILNNMSGVIYLDILCNMKTKKQTKFIGEFSEKLFFPHTFEVNLPRRCFVVCKTDEEAVTAQRLGAEFAGDETLLQRLDRKKGNISIGDFDIVLCTTEMQEALYSWRQYLKNIYPSTETFSIGDNVEEMMLKQRELVSYTCKKEGALGKIQVPIGTLNMEIDQIMENYDFFFSSLLNHPKMKQVKSGENFVTSARLLVPPCPEQLKIRDEELRRIVTPENMTQKPQKDKEEDRENVDSERFTGDLLVTA